MIQSPKARFQTDNNAREAFAKLVRSQMFIDAADMALLQMMGSLPMFGEEIVASANYRRLEGARIFLETLDSLATIPTQKTSSDTVLDHNV